MSGWLKWLPWRREPVFTPGPRPSPPLPQLEECECGRQHPVGWVCVEVIGGRS